MKINETARRCLNLFFILNSATAPLATERIIGDADLGYASGNPSSDRRAFRRDRQRLAGQGIIIREVQPEGSSESEESRWELDRGASELDASGISDDDLELLAGLTGRYMRNHPPFPGSDAIARLDAKVRGALALRRKDGVCTAPAPGIGSSAYRYDTIADRIWDRFRDRRAATFDYRDAKGAEARRTVDIYGIFNLGPHAYFVGRDHDREQIRTFRTDRIAEVLKPGDAYAVPDGFDTGEYIFLPFDFGDGAKVKARFAFSPSAPESEVEALTNGRGELSREEGGLTWSVEVRDVGAAAAWALACAWLGLRPMEPPELMDAWRARIGKAVTARA